jgi:Flp pilus assembly protein TadG
MVEFALIAPTFFMLIFTMLDGGLLLFSANAVDNASTVGSNALAALGNNQTADFLTIKDMAQAGFGNSHLITLLKIQIDGLVTDPVYGFSLDPVTHQPLVMTTCAGGPSNRCENDYTVSEDSSGDVTVTLTDQVGGGSCSYTYPAVGSPGAFACPNMPWPPSSRNITDGTSSFAELSVSYTYNYFTGIAPPLALSSIKTLRLEPQS